MTCKNHKINREAEQSPREKANPFGKSSLQEPHADTQAYATCTLSLAQVNDHKNNSKLDLHFTSLWHRVTEARNSHAT